MSDTLLSDEALRALNARLEPAHPGEIVRWALEESGLRELALASAFQAEGTCVMHMATRIRPGRARAVPGDRVPLRRDARVQARG